MLMEEYGRVSCSLTGGSNAQGQKKKKKNSPLDQIKMNGTDAKKYSSHLTIIGYFSNLPRIIFKKSSESSTTEKYLRKLQVLVTFPSTQFSVKQNYDIN